MLILKPYAPLILPPVPRLQWREPSRSVPRDQFGNLGYQVRFRVIARNVHGHAVWCGWFDDRDEADSFLASLARFLATGQPMPYAERIAPSPWWEPDLGDGLAYEFATVTFLTTGSAATYTSPVDWNNSSSSIEIVGSSGAGGAGNGTVPHASGSAGGSYGRIDNLTFATPGTTSTLYTVGTGAAAAVSGAGGAGGNVSFFGPSSAAAFLRVLGTSGGNVGTGTQLGGTSNAATSPSGLTLTAAFAGANGGACSGAATRLAAGGGGASSPSGAGASGATASSAAATLASSGGASGGGVAGGAGVTGNTAGALVANPGAAGTEWDATHGAGSGAGGVANDAAGTGTVAGVGGAYGGGSGGCIAASSNPSGSAGRQGIIVVTYGLAAGSSAMLAMFN